VAWIVLCGAAVLVASGAFLVWRRPVLALYAFIVGLIVNNTVFLLLYKAGAHGWQLTAAQAWKEVLLAVALARVVRDAATQRALPFRPRYVDAAAAVFAATVLVYAVIPQGLLGGDAGSKAVLYGLRHYLVAVAAYFVGRSLLLRRADVERLVILTVGAAAIAAVAGIVEEYTVSASQWHSIGVGSYFTDQLGFPAQHGPGGTPENFVFNSAGGVHRRLVSFFLGPLASAYFFVVAIPLAVAAITAEARRRMLVLGAAVITFVGLLFTFTRSALLALPVGLLLVALASHRRALLGVVVATAAAAVAFAAVYPHIAPHTHFLASDLAYQRQHAKTNGSLPKGDPLQTSASFSDPSEQAHLDQLRAGARVVLHHPQGYGVGNTGETAARFRVATRAGESFYLELGADAGVLGLAFWVLFTVLTLAGLVAVVRGRASAYVRRFAAGTLAAAVSIALLAVISDVWGAPWLSYVLWWFSGAALTMGERADA
jgi:O-Antigen ligase